MELVRRVFRLQDYALEGEGVSRIIFASPLPFVRPALPEPPLPQKFLMGAAGLSLNRIYGLADPRAFITKP